MTGLVIALVIAAGLAAIWAVNTFTDTLFHKGANALGDRKRVSESERIRERVRERRNGTEG